jgi:hypothetical protein
MPTPVSQSLQSTQEMQEAYKQGSVVSTYMDGSLPLYVDGHTNMRRFDRHEQDAASIILLKKGVTLRSMSESSVPRYLPSYTKVVCDLHPLH